MPAKKTRQTKQSRDNHCKCFELRRSAALLKEKWIPIFGAKRGFQLLCSLEPLLLSFSVTVHQMLLFGDRFSLWANYRFFFCKCSYKVCSLMKVFRSVPTSMQQFWLHNLCFRCRAWRAFSVGFLLCLVFQNLFKDMLLYMKKTQVLCKFILWNIALKLITQTVQSSLSLLMKKSLGCSFYTYSCY